MATTTKNLGLVKPDYTDAADIAVINSNMDKLDEAVAGLQGSGTTVTQESIENALGYTPMNPDSAFTTRQEITPDYTNLAGAYGLTEGKMLGSNGALTDNANTYVSGFIPVAAGDVIRIKDTSRTDFDKTVMFALYGPSKAEAAGIGKVVDNIITGSQYYGQMTVNGNTATWVLENITYYAWNDFAYMRVMVLSADAIITVNEPMTESVKDQHILRPEVKVTEDSLDFDVSGKPLAGKNVVCFGDSLFGMYRGDDSAPAFVAAETGATVYNVGFGGCRMSVHPSTGYAAFSMWALAKAIAENDWTTQNAQASSGSDYFSEHLASLKSLDFNEVDIVVIHYGTNDFGAGNAIQLDNTSDPDDYNTLCGALRYSLDKLLGKYPKLRIYISLPVYRYWIDGSTTTYAETYVGKSGKTLPEFVEALRSTAEEYNLPVIDGYHGLGINKVNASAFLSDGTHHNAVGRERFGRFIGANLTARP